MAAPELGGAGGKSSPKAPPNCRASTTQPHPASARPAMTRTIAAADAARRRTCSPLTPLQPYPIRPRNAHTLAGRHQGFASSPMRKCRHALLTTESFIVHHNKPISRASSLHSRIGAGWCLPSTSSTAPSELHRTTSDTFDQQTDNTKRKICCIKSYLQSSPCYRVPANKQSGLTWALVGGRKAAKSSDPPTPQKLAPHY